jgi:hypothetical protein
MAVCEVWGRDLPEVAPFSRRRSDGERETIDLCDACRTVAASAGETVTCTRKEMLVVRELADKRMLPTSLYRGQRIIGYHKWKTFHSQTGGLYMSGHWCATCV